nr:uncharacterized protein CTRU02_13747 [Colletotrichum truncatum]KAF6783095.1 hypothetical protein CTRU02_13747 [Colletotrichum truncatum]
MGRFTHGPFNPRVNIVGLPVGNSGLPKLPTGSFGYYPYGYPRVLPNPIYVDEVCIKSIVARLHGGKLIGFQWCLSSTGSVVIVNGLHQDHTPEEKDDADDDEEEEDDEGYMEVDGITHYDVGWAYIGVLGYAELYSNLGSGGSHGQIWDGMVYRGRRPERDPEPDYDYGRPLSEVERGAKYGQRIKK